MGIPSSRTADPSSVPNQFAERLSRAIAASDLSLHRVQAKLAAGGLKVSIATLSYWTTGRSRPTRGHSLDVVAGLEQVLGLPAGHLGEALPAERTAHQLTHLLPRTQDLAATLAELGLSEATPWKRMMVHVRMHIGADGTETMMETHQVTRAELDGIDSWPTVVESEQEGDLLAATEKETRFEAVSGLRLRRVASPPPHRFVVAEWVLPAPLRRGEMAYTEDRVHFGAATEPATACSYGATRLVDLLVLEALFEGDAPRSAHRSFRDLDGTVVQLVDAPVQVEAHRVHCVVASAVPGMHTLTWTW